MLWGGILCAAAAGPGAQAFVPNQRPTLEVARASAPIQIDGELDDAGWANAARAGNFAEITPGDQSQPPVDTEVLLAYDDSHLYLGFKAHDDPRTIRSSLRDRDQIFSDDWIGIILDTYGDAAWAYELFLNPVGIQGDLRWTPNDEDIRFDIVFASRGKITPDGYQVEVAIPFSSLRFPEREQHEWRATFLRTHPRDSRRQYSWATIDRDEPCFPCQFGTLTGIQGVRGATNLEVLPSITGSQAAFRDGSVANTRLDNDRADADVGLGLRYSFTSSLTGDATLNPDFSQVESDAAQIDVNTTFALFFPERRPFFQEGGDLFDTWIDAVYTRSINDPVAAAKLTGRAGRTSIGYIGGRDERTPIVLPYQERSDVLLTGRSTSNILRIKQTFLDDSFAGLLMTDQRLDGGGSGSLVGGDTSLRFRKNYRLELQGLASHTSEPHAPALTQGVRQSTFDRGKYTSEFDGEDFWGHSVYASLERDARLYDFDVDYWEGSPTFRAANGFITANDYRRTSVWNALTFRPNRHGFEVLQPNVSFGRVWDHDGSFRDEWLRPQIFARFKKQTEVSLAGLWSNEVFKSEYQGGIRRVAVEISTHASNRVQPGVYFEGGKRVARFLSKPVLGDAADLNAWATIKPMQRLIVEPSYEYSQLRNPANNELYFAEYVLRTRCSYQFTRELFLRFIVQYDSSDDLLELDPLLTYRVNPFTVFYLGSTHDLGQVTNERGGFERRQTERHFFVKLQYLFRV